MAFSASYWMQNFMLFPMVLMVFLGKLNWKKWQRFKAVILK